MTPACYLCGATSDLTRDHLPPKGFFPEPRPKDLITVPCCRSCNERASLDDEAFRLWAAAPPEVSKAGHWVRENKVFASTFKRSPKLVENLKEHIHEVEMDGKKVDLISLPEERAERFLFRLTKGLLAYFYPTFPRDSQIFSAIHVTLYKNGWDKITAMRDFALYDSRGDGVFQFRRCVSFEKKSGYWMYCFYEASLLIVLHEKG